MKHISLFSGIGGFDLAAEWMGWENIAHCEINEFCLKILKYYWPNAKTHTDIKSTDFTIYRGLCDILTGGFPCQGFSLAGLRLGTDDNRYLWPEYLRAIDEIQPAFVLGENVTGILSMEDKSGVYRDVFAKVENRKITRLYPVDEYEAIYTRQAKMLVNSICESLEERGYEMQTFAIPAASVGAPHKRERIWFVATNTERVNRRRESSRHSESTRETIRESLENSTQYGFTSNTDCNGYRCHNGTGQTGSEEEESERIENQWEWVRDDSRGNGTTGNVADTDKNRGKQSGCQHQTKFVNQNGSKERIFTHTINEGYKIAGDGKSISREKNQAISGVNGRSSPYDWANWPTQSPVCNGNDGLSTRLDGITFSKWRNESIKGGGNAVVPALVVQIFKAIEAYEYLNTSPSTPGTVLGESE